MDIDRAEQLFNKLTEIVAHPLYEESPRITLAATLAVTSMQYAASVRVLCVHSLLLGASTAIRSQFEALIRSVWALHCASDHQLGRLTTDLNKESQRASKNIPLANEMLCDLERVPQLHGLLVALNEFKESSWLPLNSFVHAGLHAVHWTKHRPPTQLVERLFRMSNGLTLLAFQGLGVLTGRLGIQDEIIAATASFASCLPERRERA